MGLKVENGRVVTLTYRIIDREGVVLDEKTPIDPYQYVQGDGQIVPAIEIALDGKTPGYTAEIHLTPREGYGEYDPSLVADLPRSQFPMSVDLEVGMKFNTLGPKGETRTIRIIELDEKNATVDGNHPLAGIELTFEVRILDVQAAAESKQDISPERVHVLKVKPSSGSMH